VSGSLRTPPRSPASAGARRQAQAADAWRLNKTHRPILPAFTTSEGFKTPIPLQITGNTFTIDVPLSVEDKRPLHGERVAKLPDQGSDHDPARTIAVP
jgi:hypothetical protein